MARVYNFSAGPAVLPEEVLREAAAEMLDYKGTGMSVGFWGQTLSLFQLQSADLHGSCGPSASHLHIDCLQICASHYERKIPNGVGIAKRAL